MFRPQLICNAKDPGDEIASHYHMHCNSIGAELIANKVAALDVT